LTPVSHVGCRGQNAMDDVTRAETLVDVAFARHGERHFFLQNLHRISHLSQVHLEFTREFFDLAG
jgi:hypothetical protein